MLDHGLIASHASKSSRFVFLQVHSNSGSVTYHENLPGLISSTTKTLCQTSDLAANQALQRPSTSHKALGTQTVFPPPEASTQRPRTSHASLSCACIPSRNSSLSHNPGKQMPPTKRRCKTVSLHHRNRKQFSSIDEMLAFSSDSDREPVATNSASQLSPGRSPTHFNTIPSRKRPSLSRSPKYTTPSISPEGPQPPHQNTPAAGPTVPLRTSSSLPLLTAKAPSIKQPNHVHTFPTSTLDFAHHPSPPHTSHAKRPSLHQPHNFSWTSDATRRREYAKIDRAHSGLRGFCRRMLPVCFRNGRRNFWDAENHNDDDDGDADSVRRYRLRLPESPRSMVADEKSPLVAARGRGLSCF